MVGDVTPAAATALAAQKFGAWKAAPAATTAAALPGAAPAPRVLVVDLPDAGQARIVGGRPAIAPSASRRYAVEVANATLGVGFSSTIVKEQHREKGSQVM